MVVAQHLAQGDIMEFIVGLAALIIIGRWLFGRRKVKQDPHQSVTVVNNIYPERKAQDGEQH